MDFLLSIIDYIARTNLFNFVIFSIIIAYLVKKINVRQKMDDAVDTVRVTIDESEDIKSKSEEKLSGIEASLSHLEEDIAEIITQSEENAKIVGEKILADAQNAVVIINENVEKSVENSKVLLKNDLLRSAALASVEVAKLHIIEELNRNPELHSKLIDESLMAIEGVEL